MSIKEYLNKKRRKRNDKENNGEKIKEKIKDNIIIGYIKVENHNLKQRIINSYDK